MIVAGISAQQDMCVIVENDRHALRGMPRSQA